MYPVYLGLKKWFYLQFTYYQHCSHNKMFQRLMLFLSLSYKCIAFFNNKIKHYLIKHMSIDMAALYFHQLALIVIDLLPFCFSMNTLFISNVVFWRWMTPSRWNILHRIATTDSVKSPFILSFMNIIKYWLSKTYLCFQQICR